MYGYAMNIKILILLIYSNPTKRLDLSIKAYPTWA
jgi:hypothetical protein